MSRFDKSLIIKDLRVLRYFGVAFLRISRCRYGAIAMPLRCNRVAVTVKWRRDYTVTATPFGQKPTDYADKGAPLSCFPVLNAQAFKC